MNLESKIFVAGHRGMVGSAIVRLLESRGYKNIIRADRSKLNLIHQTETNQFFEEHKPEYVFLAAARVGGIHANNTYRAEFFYQNVMIAANCIDAARRFGTRKLVNLGSSCIYPKFADQPLREDSLLTGALEHTNEPYAIAKIAAVKMCRYYNEQYDTNFLSLMPTNLYGPNDNYDLETSHVLPALIRKFVLARFLLEERFDRIRNNLMLQNPGFGRQIDNISTNDELCDLLASLGVRRGLVSLWGSGRVFREFLHADDLASAALYFMEQIHSRDAGEIVNIGTGVDVSIHDLAHSIAQLAGYEGKIGFDSSKPDGTPRKLLDVTKARDLGWSSSIDLDDGLRSVIKDYLLRY